jgi:hypothetical protein
MNKWQVKWHVGRVSVFYLVFLFVSSVLLTELSLRAYFAYRVGPDVLMYGIRSGSVSFENSGVGAVAEPARPPHPEVAKRFLGDMIQRARLESPAWYPDARSRGYRKYRPNQVRYDFASGSGERFQVKINSRGFRGREFAEAKRPGVVRVVTLGASSTFGYYNRDSETYPAQLEQILRSGCTTKNYEVINLGIPHLKASQSALLFRSEGLPLDPDVVTFYEGVNDAMALVASTQPRAPWLDSMARRVLPCSSASWSMLWAGTTRVSQRASSRREPRGSADTSWPRSLGSTPRVASVGSTLWSPIRKRRRSLRPARSSTASPTPTKRAASFA